MLSKAGEIVKEAYEKGYRVINGIVISPFSEEEIAVRINNKTDHGGLV
jgi:hypothetical protein